MESTSNDTRPGGDTAIPAAERSGVMMGSAGTVVFGPAPVSPEFIALCRDQTLEDALMLVQATAAADDLAAGPKVKHHLDLAMNALQDAQAVIEEQS